jgi:hypothetical protein
MLLVSITFEDRKDQNFLRMRDGRRQLKTWLGVTLGIIVLVTGALLTYGYLLRREAQSVLDDVSALSSARNRDSAFIALQQKYGTRMRAVEALPRSRSYEITVSNHLLSTLLRLPYTELSARFDIMGTSLTVVMLEYRCAQSSAKSPVVTVQTDFWGSPDTHFYLNPWAPTSGPDRWNGIVEMGFATDPELKKAALSLNLDCLTRMGGCIDIAELLPSVWRTAKNRVECLVPNQDGQAR